MFTPESTPFAIFTYEGVFFSLLDTRFAFDDDDVSEEDPLPLAFSRFVGTARSTFSFFRQELSSCL